MARQYGTATNVAVILNQRWDPGHPSGYEDDLMAAIDAAVAAAGY